MLLSSWLRSARRRAAVAWVGVERDESDATRFWGGSSPRCSGRARSRPATRSPRSSRRRGRPGRVLERCSRGSRDWRSRSCSSSRTSTSCARARRCAASSGCSRARRATCAGPPRAARDPKLGLHRLRLAGELTEIRAADLEFTAEEAGELLAAPGSLGAGDLGRLHARTEGWAAGLRLAAMSLSRHRGPSASCRVLGQRADRRGLPARRGARQPAARGPPAAAAHLASSSGSAARSPIS